MSAFSKLLTTRDSEQNLLAQLAIKNLKYGRISCNAVLVEHELKIALLTPYNAIKKLLKKTHLRRKNVCILKLTRSFQFFHDFCAIRGVCLKRLSFLHRNSFLYKIDFYTKLFQKRIY